MLNATLLRSVILSVIMLIIDVLSVFNVNLLIVVILCALC
jgi:hypothetical protein